MVDRRLPPQWQWATSLAPPPHAAAGFDHPELLESSASPISAGVW